MIARSRSRSKVLVAGLVVAAVFASLAAPVGGQQRGVDDQDPVRLVFDDPGAAQRVADSIPEADVVNSTTLFAAVDVPAEEVREAAEVGYASGAEAVELDAPVYPASFDDPDLSRAFGLAQMQMPEIWRFTQGTPETVIAIIDTGVAEVPELAGRIAPGASFGTSRPARVPLDDPNDDQHGTMSAVVAAGALGNGVVSAGSCPNCSILPVRVFENSEASASMSAVAAGIIWATDNGADVISMSLSGPRSIQALDDAVRYAQERGVVLLGAAGNGEDGIPTIVPQYPAALPEVIGVSAIDQVGELYSWSNRGDWVGASAAGCNWAQDDSAQTRIYCGTSSATPLLAGALALYRSALPASTPTQIRERLSTSQVPVVGTAGGYLDATALFATSRNPAGALEEARQLGAGVVEVSGWAHDPDSPEPLTINVLVNGALAATALADEPRPDIASTRPGAGPNHGYRVQVPASVGSRQVCVEALNVGLGAGNTLLGCETVTVATPSEESWPQAPFSDVNRPSWQATPVDWAFANGVTKGIGGSRFDPNGGVSRAQAFTMLWRDAGEPVPAIANPFSDVPANTWYTDAAIWAYEEGITNGVGGSNRFAPSSPLSRAQAVTILWRYSGEPTPTVTNPFLDVSPRAYYATAATWAYEEGITNGVGGSNQFMGARPVTRAENITFLWRFAGSPEGP